MELEGFRELEGFLHCAVYALVFRGEVVYVGQSRQPWVRLYAHATARGKRRLKGVSAGGQKVKQGVQFDQVFIRPCMLAELDRLELEMIKKYRPRHNVKDVPKLLLSPADLAVLTATLTQIMPPSVPRIDRRF